MRLVEEEPAVSGSPSGSSVIYLTVWACFRLRLSCLREGKVRDHSLQLFGHLYLIDKPGEFHILPFNNVFFRLG